MRYQTLAKTLDTELNAEKSFDIIKRTMTIGGYPAAMYMIDGFVKDEVMEKVMEFLLSAKREEIDQLPTPQAFADRFISYVETDITGDVEKAVTSVLSGTIALIFARFGRVFLIDARTYPSRGVEEPEDDRVLRGSHDGFCETLVMNTALIRRRIRDPRLTVKIKCAGKSSRTDIAIVYIEGRADASLVKKLSRRIDALGVDALTMAQESLAEALNRKGFLNPFPKVRYTERPDAAAASVLEGKIALIVDNSPTVILLPTSVFDFVEDANDFYFPPLIGTYLRWVRFIMFAATLFLTPVWYLLVTYAPSLPEWLKFIAIEEPARLPLIAQLLIFELVMDGLKLASLNTPSSLSNSFSVVGALILGEFAVSSGLFCPDVILYMALSSVANFTQPSFELGYAFKLVRMLTLILIALFGLWGFIAGVAVLVLLLVFNRTLTGFDYLYPLIPLDIRALSSLIARKRVPRRGAR